MTYKEIITAILIHLIVPLIGLAYYIKIVRQIRKEKINNPPIISLFIIFATYGGLLLIVLTNFFWLWSGMASLGAFYLILIAPIIMGLISFNQYKIRGNSKYHKWAYITSISYFVITPIIFLLLFIIESVAH